MTTTPLTAQERLDHYEAQIPRAQAAFDKAVAAVLSVGSDVSNNLTLLGWEVSEEVLGSALDNIEHLAHLADLARNAKEALSDWVFCAAAARQELEDERRYQREFEDRCANQCVCTDDEKRAAGALVDEDQL